MEIKITLNGVEQTVTKNQIFDLAAKGTIRPDTNINVDGRQIPAAKIKGIVFENSSNNPTPSPTKPSAQSQQKTINNPTPAQPSASSPLPQKTANDPTSVFAPLSDLPTDFPSFDFPQQESANNSAPTQSYPQYSSRSQSYRDPNAGSGKATASFVCGLLGILFCGGLMILPVIGLVLGLFGVKSKNQGLAIAGIVMSCIGFFFAFASILVLMPAVQAARAAAQGMQCQINEKKIVEAIYGFHEKHNALPARYTIDENGKPLHSWRVLILPFLGEKELYDKIRLDEPWDSEHNRQFHSKMPSVYACPANRSEATYKCCYSAIAGNGKEGNEGALTPAKEAKLLVGTTTLTSIANLNNIILIIEVKEPFCWMDPWADKTFSDLEVIATNKNGSFHIKGFHGMEGDKKLLLFDDSITPNILIDMGTRSGMGSASSIRSSMRSRIVPSLRSPRPTADPGTITISPKPIPPPPPRVDPSTIKLTPPSPPTLNLPPGSRVRQLYQESNSPKKEPKTTPKTTTPKKEPSTTKPKSTTPRKEPATPRRRTRPSKDDDDQDFSRHSVTVSPMLATVYKGRGLHVLTPLEEECVIL